MSLYDHVPFSPTHGQNDAGLLGGTANASTYVRTSLYDHVVDIECMLLEAVTGLRARREMISESWKFRGAL